MCVMPASRYAWRATTVLLCALLLQNCQSNSLSAVEAETPTKTPLQSGRQMPASGTLTQRIGHLSSAPLAAATRNIQTPCGPCVHSGKAGLLGEMPGKEGDEKENAKPPAKRPFSNLGNELPESSKKAHIAKKCVRRVP